MRAAAIQLNANAEVDRNLEAAERLVRAAAAAGAELVLLPEKWSALAPGGGPRPSSPSRSTARSSPPAASWARELGITPRRRQRRRAGRRPRAARQHLAADRSPTARSPPPIARSTCSTSTSAGSPTESPSTSWRATRSSRRRAGDRRGRADRLLRPPLPRALPDPRPARGDRGHRPVGLHRRHRARPLGGPGPRPGDREPALRDRRQPVRRGRRRSSTPGGIR